VKIQDILFLLGLFFLIYKKDSRLSLIVGISLLFVAIPLFFLQIFFTAQHLVYYSAAFILLSVFIMIFKEKYI
jgi:hypothetical protein